MWLLAETRVCCHCVWQPRYQFCPCSASTLPTIVGHECVAYCLFTNVLRVWARNRARSLSQVEERGPFLKQGWGICNEGHKSSLYTCDLSWQSRLWSSRVSCQAQMEGGGCGNPVVFKWFCQIFRAELYDTASFDLLHYNDRPQLEHLCPSPLLTYTHIGHANCHERTWSTFIIISILDVWYICQHSRTCEELVL